MIKPMITALSLLVISSLLNADSMFEVADNGDYLHLEFLPLCTNEGQTIFQITNVSGQDLLVDPAFMEIEKYDAMRFGIQLDILDSTAPPPKMTNKITAEGQYGWFPMAAGTVIQHKIDFRDYAVSPLDTSLWYLPSFNGMPIRIITTIDGKKITMFDSVLDTTLSDKFGPECWK
jgi:hypothetical protein